MADAEMSASPTKAQLRARALGLRRMHSTDERLFAALAATERILPHLVPTNGTIALYHPYRDELDPGPLADRLAALGRDLALPVTRSRRDPLLFRRWAPGDSMATGQLGIAEPVPEAPEVFPAVLVVPLAAFDARGFRIGYGAGHYDRTIPHLRAMHPVVAIGYAYACQRVEAVPDEPHDVALDLIVTEDAVHGGGA